MLMNLVQWILHKALNHLFQCRLGIQLDLSTFGALSPIRHSSNDICPSVRLNELLRPTSLLHRSPLICFWLLSGLTPESFQVSPILYPLLLLLRVSSMFSHDFGHLCRRRRIPKSGHSDFGIINNLGASSIFTWFQRIIWYFCNDIHYFRSRHLECWWALFSEHCIDSRFILHNISSEHNVLCTSEIVIPTPHSLHDRCPSLKQSGLCFFVFCATFITSCCFWLSPTAKLEQSQAFFHSLSTPAFASGIFITCGNWMNLCTKL